MAYSEDGVVDDDELTFADAVPAEGVEDDFASLTPAFWSPRLSPTPLSS